MPRDDQIDKELQFHLDQRTAIALGAAALPAYRAARIDSADVLREG
jgi:ABC-type lipoprotein release transport system permease subunit